MAVGKSIGSLWLSRSSRLILLAVWALCLAFACHIWQSGIARADGSVTYEQRNYVVQIQRDGMIQVNEHWQVHFSGGPFHHAFLALYLAKTSGITFSQVAGGVTNQQVSETTDASGNPMVQVAWDYPETSDATRTFDIPYTVEGALGIGTSQAWLDWRFLDGGSETSFPVAAAEVRVTLPAVTNAQQWTVNTADSDGTPQMATPDTRTVVVTGGQLTSNVPMEVGVAFPRDQIDASEARPAWQSTDTPPSLPTAPGVDQPVNDPGSYNPRAYNPGTGDYGASPVRPFNPLDIFGPMLTVCFLPLGLLVLSALGLGRKGGGWGYRGGSRFWNNSGGPWYRGPGRTAAVRGWVEGGFGGGGGGGSSGFS